MEYVAVLVYFAALLAIGAMASRRVRDLGDCFVASLVWPRFDARGALAAMLTGAVCVPLFQFAVPEIPVWGPWLARLEELAPAFVLSALAGVLATRLGRRPGPGV